MSLRDSRDNTTLALWRWDNQVDAADDQAEAAEAAARRERVEAWGRKSLEAFRGKELGTR